MRASSSFLLNGQMLRHLATNINERKESNKYNNRFLHILGE
jgi:hypothetical protein